MARTSRWYVVLAAFNHCQDGSGTLQKDLAFGLVEVLRELEQEVDAGLWMAGR